MTLTVRRQLLALVTLAVLGFAVLGSVSLVQMGRVFSGASFAADNTVPSLLVLDDAMDTLATQRLRFWQLLTQTDPGAIARLKAEFHEARQRTDAALIRYDALIADGKDAAMLAVDR